MWNVFDFFGSILHVTDEHQLLSYIIVE